MAGKYLDAKLCLLGLAGIDRAAWCEYNRIINDDDSNSELIDVDELKYIAEK